MIMKPMKKNQMSRDTFARLLYRKFKDSGIYKINTEEPLSYRSSGSYEWSVEKQRKIMSDKEINRAAGKVLVFFIENRLIAPTGDALENNYNSWRLVKKRPEIVDLIFL